MSYQIAQDFEYAGNDYWRWWAWIEADDAELDAVQAVVWILHPTFKQSRVLIADRASKFQLKTAGWGTFLLRAEVALKCGEKHLLKHNLRLEYPEPSAGTPQTRTGDAMRAARQLTVFLSYSVQDTRAAARLRESLKKAGLDVLDQTRIEAADSPGDAVKRMIAQSDAVVALITDDEISPWVRDELAAASTSDKPSFALLSRQASGAGLPGAVHTLQVDASESDASKIADLLLAATRG